MAARNPLVVISGQLQELPAGDTINGAAAGAALTFTASGAISAGLPLEMNSDGTVSTITTTGASKGTSAAPYATGTWAASEVVFCVSAGLYLYVYSDSNASPVLLRYSVGTRTGTTISWAAPVTIDSHTTMIGALVTYDTVQNKAVVVYGINGALNVRAIDVTSGGVVTVGAAAVVSAAATAQSNKTAVCYSPSAGAVVVGYYTTGTIHGYVVTVTVSGTTCTVNTAVQIHTGSANVLVLCYDHVSGYVVAFINTPASGLPTVYTYSISGTTLTLANSAAWTAVANITVQSAMVAHANGVVVIAADGTNPTYYMSFTINSGTGVITLRNGSTWQTLLATTGSGTKAVAKRNPVTGNIGLCLYGTATIGTTYYSCDLSTGWTLSVVSSVALLATTNSPIVGGVAFEPTVNYGIAIHKTSSVNLWPSGAVIQDATSTLLPNNFVGFSQNTVSSGAAVTVAPTGTKAAGLSGLTIAQTYYVSYLGALQTTVTANKAGLACSATSILVGAG